LIIIGQANDQKIIALQKSLQTFGVIRQPVLSLPVLSIHL